MVEAVHAAYGAPVLAALEAEARAGEARAKPKAQAAGRRASG